ncbi:hypothetical protein J6590_057425 [Homalodisca vitripennis]|nr:hypothetical protein J6590_057425 [Homalodisca vitripennis]
MEDCTDVAKCGKYRGYYRRLSHQEQRRRHASNEVCRNGRRGRAANNGWEMFPGYINWVRALPPCNDSGLSALVGTLTALVSATARVSPLLEELTLGCKPPRHEKKAPLLFSEHADVQEESAD